MLFTLLGINTDFKLLHLLNKEEAIDFTPSGMIKEVRLLHPWKAPLPIDVKLFGTSTDVKLLQFLKA
jgi:hypothetical protein